MKKTLIVAAIMCIAASAYAFARAHSGPTQSGLAGRWKAVFVGKENIRPKMFSEVVFDLQVDGDKITGTATMADWPGVAPISDGVLKGDHVSLVAIGNIDPLPKMVFDGTIEGEVMKLTMTWRYVASPNDATAPKWEMEARRVPK